MSNLKIQEKYNNYGFTLIELLVSIALFSTVVVITSSIFIDVSDNQQNAIAAQSVQDNLRFAYENLSKEMRTARSYQPGKDCGGGVSHKTYNTENGAAAIGNQLYFVNQFYECVHYYLNNGQLMVGRGPIVGSLIDLPMTPDDINIKDLYFHIYDDLAGSFQTRQPMVTMKMEVEMRKGKQKLNQNMIIHTTVSARGYYIEPL
jgi:prepilin-type N-terminal cleavage/methylation domain-containing protein